MAEVEEFLEHWGIRGMRWGVRNKSKIAGSGRRPPVDKSKKGREGRTTFDKRPTRLSEAELNRRIKRMEMEKRYLDLNAPIKSKGKQFSNSLMEQLGKGLATTVVMTTAGFFIGKFLKDKFS